MDNSKFTGVIGKLYQELSKLKSSGKLQLLNQYIHDKQRLIIISSITGLVIIGSSYGIYYFNSDTIYHVIVDGEEIGIVNDKDIVINWEEEQANKIKQELNSTELNVFNEITFKSERKIKTTYDNEQTLTSLGEIIKFETTGVEIIVDGKVIGVVNNQEIAENLINQIKEEYMPKKGLSVSAASVEDSNSQEIQLNDVEIKEEVTFQDVIVNPDEVMLEEDMFTLLKKGTLEEKVYTVQEGDTISGIAARFDLTTDQIYKMNTWLSGELIHIGDEIVVTALTPPVTVKTSEITKQTERIPYKVEYKSDSSMFINESKVLVKGVEGEKLVEYSFIKENGIIIEKIILDEETIKDPITKVILKGTKLVPTKSSGTIGWPTYGGIITSPYGPRWGTFHYGIDISGVSDRTIKAADNGTVSFAGYNGGYGNCVIINHENGIQTLYGHLSTISVSVGTSIAKGQKIGVMGNTGNSYGVHLHFEVIVNGEKKNPINYVGN
ncbi:MAG: peptidoglycan DD-metalloendopeptidase family protein [Vulcanibacillus sp.]